MVLPRSLRRCCFAWLLAAMALLGQVLGAAARPEMEADPVGVICGVDQPSGSQAPALPHQRHGHHHDCAVCPLCAAAAVHAALVSPGPVLLQPAAAPVVAPVLPPPARAPPSWQFSSPFPRGPPASA